MRVIRNVIPAVYQLRIKQMMLDVGFPWGYLEDVTYRDTDEVRNRFPNANGSQGFAHLFYDDETNTHSEFCNIIMPLFFSFVDTHEYNLFRIKGGLLLPQGALKSPYNMPHVDMNRPHTTALYYVNTADGETVFFDENNNEVRREKPEAGKVIIFDGSVYHASQNPTRSTNRITLNFNYEH